MGSAALARRQALDILHEGRFHAPAVPRPLHGVLRAIGGAVDPLRSAVDALVSWLAGVLPGGRVAAWSVLAILLGAITALLASTTTRRLLREPPAADPHTGEDPPPTAAALERAAEDARSGGQLDEAIRLLFRAGLSRLTEQGRLPPAAAMSNLAVARAVGSGDFDMLARQFDTIVYGHRHAAAEDYESTRSRWARVHAARGTG
jgi:hypothetical protein